MTDKTPKDEDLSAIHAAMELVYHELSGMARCDELLGISNVRLTNELFSEESLDKKIDLLIEKLGGVPRLIVVREGEPKQLFDNYADSVINELLTYYKRAKRAVSKAATTRLGVSALHSIEDELNIPSENGVRASFLSLADEMFWEYAEVAFIRLSSYWDRVGQLLAFAFFHIRQYERDGFSSVMQKIQQNVRPVDMELLATPAWNSLWDYSRADATKEDGFNWLASRRNALVHSLHLRPVEAPEESEYFDTMFNNIDDAVLRKLKPGTPEIEAVRLITQLKKAAELFPAVLAVAERGAELRHKSRKY